ncbi:MAG: hypothetical protein IJ730_04385, partial [Alphaproteobacteria bacterium]|nr:hypothetical protein [Alphaproteobacteria bacterium]
MATMDGMDRDRLEVGVSRVCKFARQILWLNDEGLQRELDRLATEMLLVLDKMAHDNITILCPFTMYELDQLRSLHRHDDMIDLTTEDEIDAE